MLNSTGVSSKSKHSDLEVYICSVLIHFEHLPASTRILAMLLAGGVLANVLYQSVPMFFGIFGANRLR